MMTLGLDVSTSITGFSIIEDGKLIYFNAVNTKNKKKFTSINCVTEAIEEELMQIKKIYKIDNIYIEESLKSFARNSTANTIILLSQINALVTWVCFKIFNVEPIHVSAISMRSKLGIDTKTAVNPGDPKPSSAQRRKKTKQAVLNHVQSIYSEFVCDINRAGNIKEDYYDMADAIVVAMFGNGVRAVGKTKNP